MLRRLPKSTNPNLLVGFETSDDAGVFLLPDGHALVQTMDFFTPIVDDPYSFGAISAANALSDVYAMGGRPLTVMNIACFNPLAAPAEVWAAIMQGSYDKVVESGAVVVGGHSVEDNEPKFGLSVTGLVDPERMFANTNAVVGDRIFLSKPLGTGVITGAAKHDVATAEEIAAAIEAMSTLNAGACAAALAVGCRCATDITGFGLAGHLWNVARGSGVRIEISGSSLPLLPGVERLILLDQTTGGGFKNRKYLGEALSFGDGVPEWMQHLVVDPQTSGGLAVFARDAVEGSVEIGRVVGGDAGIVFG